MTDEKPDVKNTMLITFLGKEVEGFDAEIAVVLHPLPHLPICICYQAADEDIESDLNIFFDEYFLGIYR